MTRSIRARPAFRDRAFRELDRLEIEACRNKELYPYTRDVLCLSQRNMIYIPG